MASSPIGSSNYSPTQSEATISIVNETVALFKHQQQPAQSNENQRHARVAFAVEKDDSDSGAGIAPAKPAVGPQRPPEPMSALNKLALKKVKQEVLKRRRASLVPVLDKYQQVQRQRDLISKLQAIAIATSFIAMLIMFLPLALPAAILACRAPAKYLSREAVIHRYKVAIGLAVSAILIGTGLWLTMALATYVCSYDLGFEIEYRTVIVEPESYTSYECKLRKGFWG